MNKNKKCPDCGKIIWYNSKTCQSCATKRQLKNPINHPKFKDGRTINKYYCINCGKKISRETGIKGKGRCLFCANTGNNNPMSGRKNFTVIHHIDLNRENNSKKNLLQLTQNIHSSLHHRAYDYLVKIGQINSYINWFLNTYKGNKIRA